jgi:hypothetical protein
VWPALITELVILVGSALAIYFAARLIRLPASLTQPVAVIFALLPVALWFLITYWREQRAVQPRRQLLLVMVITALAANAISVPLLESVFEVERWLSLESAINRIVGYTLTVGTIQEFTKYFVLRLLVWPGQITSRFDTVAYGVACAISYATIFSIHFILTADPALDIAVLRVVDNLTVSVAGSLIVAYGLAEVRFNRAVFPGLLPATLALAALITGIAIPLRAGLTSAGLLVEFPPELSMPVLSITSPIRGFLFSVAVVVVVITALIFLFENAERRAREAAVTEA